MINLRDIILILSFGFVVFVVFWYLFGHSPTFDQGFLLLMTGFVISNSLSIKGIKTSLRYHEKYVDHRLDRIESDIRELSNSVNMRFEKIDQRFEKIDQRFEAMTKRFDLLDGNMKKIFSMQNS